MARLDDLPPASPSGTSRPRREWIVIVALWLMVLASSSQVMIVAPILPRIGEELAVPAALQGTLVTGFAFSMSIFAVSIGPVSDHLGRRAVLLFGTGAMTIALLLHALAFDYASILGVRIAAGAAAGVLTGSAAAYIGDYFPYERRGWASGWVMSGISAGQLVGVPAGTVLAARFGFHAPFSSFAIAMAGSCLLVFVAVPQVAGARAQGRLTLGKGARTYGELLRRPQVVAACVAQAAMFFSVWSFLTHFPSWAESALTMDAEQVAALFVVGGLASVVAGPFAGRLSDRVGRKPLVLLSCFGTVVLFSLAPFLPGGQWSAYVLLFVAMGLFAIRLSPFQALLTALVPDGQRGSLMSLVIATGQLGGGIGAALAGWIYGGIGFLACVLMAAAAMLVAAVVVAAGLPEPRGQPRAAGVGLGESDR